MIIRRIIDALLRRRAPQYRGWQDVGWIDEAAGIPEGLLTHAGTADTHRRMHLTFQPKTVSVKVDAIPFEVMAKERSDAFTKALESVAVTALAAGMGVEYELHDGGWTIVASDNVPAGFVAHRMPAGGDGP